MLSSLRDLGLELGRGCYGGWDDADPALARSVWCVTRHLRPSVVVETGVARGLTTRLALEALARNGTGRMWSVDLPPQAPELADQTAIAVPLELRSRWRLLRGASRNQLPILDQELADQNLPVDLFVHDSLHTGRNVRFELEWAWAQLSAAGVAIVDDIEQNAAFTAFARAHPDARAVVCDAADGRSQFGCLFRRALQ
jgi:predicted O-methyltransferase YrrM